MPCIHINLVHTIILESFKNTTLSLKNVLPYRFTLAVSSLYVQHFFKEEAKNNTLEMIGNIREEMYKTLQTLDWMDDKTKYVIFYSVQFTDLLQYKLLKLYSH